MSTGSKFANKMKSGQRMTIAGFITAIIGIITYSIAGFSVGANKDIIEIVKGSESLSEIVSIGLIAVGAGVWIVGQVVYLIAAVDQGYEENEKNSK